LSIPTWVRWATLDGPEIVGRRPVDDVLLLKKPNNFFLELELSDFPSSDSRLRALPKPESTRVLLAIAEIWGVEGNIEGNGDGARRPRSADPQPPFSASSARLAGWLAGWLGGLAGGWAEAEIQSKYVVCKRLARQGKARQWIWGD
jgi:hypothetical protein